MAYTSAVQERLRTTLKEVTEAGLLKEERYICSEQGVEIAVEFPRHAPDSRHPGGVVHSHHRDVAGAVRDHRHLPGP